ncbi:MAG: diguanylate cyclase [Alphaproteobacteria bacterium]|nr:MAG: diguanylate cyclase [Alphaproteobacteria bacterium]
MLGAAVDDAQADPLTGLATRDQLMARLDALLPGGPSQAARPGLILVDLDRFRAMSDGLGPLVCDKLLARVGSRLQAIVPMATLLARVSGDGFGVLLDDGSDAVATAGRLLDFLGRPYSVKGHPITISARLGIAVADGHGDDANSIFHAANLALHHAQRSGGNRLQLFNMSMRQSAERRQALENDFRAAIALQRVELLRALNSEQFKVYYQPLLSLADNRLTGFEALLRWHHPERGLVSPDEFIPLAEEFGLISLIGEWVLRTACREAATWPVPKSGVPLKLAINVSPLQLRQGETLLAAIRVALAETGLSVDRLEIELTEIALADDVGDTLHAIRALGVKLVLDDFGTGYSSLSRLHKYPFSRLKIDRSFVAGNTPATDAVARRSSEGMVRAIAALGAGLGLDTVIEGVETPRQREIARLAGCTEMQGFLVSPPVLGAALPALIARLDFVPDRSANTPDADLYTLAYFSRSATPLRRNSLAAIDDILHISRTNNGKLGITGALLFGEGYFAQVLEGPLPAVEIIFEKIGLDTRHRDITILYNRPLLRRDFSGWSMACVGAIDIHRLPDDIHGVVDDGACCETALTGQQILEFMQALIRKYDGDAQLAPAG